MITLPALLDILDDILCVASIVCLADKERDDNLVSWFRIRIRSVSDRIRLSNPSNPQSRQI